MSNNPSHLQFNTAEQKPQYHLIWDAVDEKGFVHRNIHEIYKSREDGLAAFEGLKASGAANIRGFCDATKSIVVNVNFPNSKKIYTYLHNEVAEPNQLAVVNTSSGLKLVKVVNCEIKSYKELSTKMPLENYKHIVGLVK